MGWIILAYFAGVATVFAIAFYACWREECRWEKERKARPDGTYRPATWLDTFPELRTRPDLVAFLRENPSARHHLFETLTQFESLARRIHGLTRPVRYFEAFYRETRRNIAESSFWQRLDREHPEIYSLAISVLKNARLNWIRYLSPGAQCGDLGVFDVDRGARVGEKAEAAEPQ